MSVVIWAEVGDQMILLGSDLQNENSDQVGWNAIVKSPVRSKKFASVFKIPHHGSRNGHNPDVWAEMICAEPFVLLTPFMLGNIILPTETDVERICQLTKKAFITAAPKGKKIRRERVVEEFIRGATKSIRTVTGSFGHIRLRTSDRSSPLSWKYEMFGSAIPLSETYR
jgi:hypothetical protein